MYDTMERPLKRPRLSLTPDPLEQNEAEGKQGEEEILEEWDLQAARTQNDMRLKSIFEGIFSKYGKDFTDIGDEIDLQTGNIVVDNGHLSGMRKEDDAGETADAWFHEAALSEGDTDQENGTHEGQETIMKRDIPEYSLGPATEDEAAKSPLNNALVDYGPDLQKDVEKPVVKSQPASDPFYKDTGPADPVWQAPELPAIFSTPTAETRRKGVSPKLPNITREASPPGSGSLWSLPRVRRPRTEGKAKATPSKRRPRAKRKYHSSPMLHDWSFAATPDGDESDDPLQEFEPSPSPSLLKRKGSAKVKHGRSILPPACTDSPLSRQPFFDTQPLKDQSAPEAEAHPAETQEPTAEREETRHLEFEDDSNLSNLHENDSYATPNTPLIIESSPSEKSPVKSPRGLTPDEAKLIVCMRHLQKKKWQEIHDHIPTRTRASIYQWNTHHWADCRECPPPLSAPWSQAESEILEQLKDGTDLSWLDFQKEFPDRTKAEIEFELLRLWVGDEVWFGEGYRAPEQTAHQEEEEEEEVKNEPAAGPEDSEKEEEAVSEESDASPEPVHPKLPEGISTPVGRKRLRIFEDLMDDDDDDEDPLASSPSKLSAIFLDSPNINRQGSRTPRGPSPAKRLKFTT
ncbi:hypothetical protein N7478_000255 [Penicillium angulare]|uniref:uncharacterized protein n=1 Tax=Penicillium angulare TaxID=116970 RepID=UPI002540535E|nr:uncharacterized protein N7478_000255 [Penicillium angulare]KAJ5291004.1 hypothetical protein N7478_000255 [Penicillium angulare]